MGDAGIAVDVLESPGLLEVLLAHIQANGGAANDLNLKPSNEVVLSVLKLIR
jgi:hypothetical protein